SSGQQAQANGAETVDPIQIYDPYPDIQRRLEAERAAKVLQERARAEKKRMEQEAEARKQEELRREEERKAEEQRQIEEQRQAEEPGGAPAPSTAHAPSSAGIGGPSTAGEGDESQMRLLMEQMRALNAKNPAMMARIWEEERVRSNTSPAQRTAQSGPAQSPQPQKSPAQQTQIVEQRRPTPAAATQQAPQPVHHIQQAPQPTHPIQQPQATPSSGSGTVWPVDKMDQISRAASDFLNAAPGNANKQITSEQIYDLLNRKPTYIELCQWLETQGLKFERATFARALLIAVPDINRAQQPKAAQASTAALPATVDTAQSHIGAQGISDTHPNSASNRLQALQGHLQDQRSSYPPPEVAQTNSPYFAPAKTPNAQPALATPPPQIAKPATKAEAARKRDFSEMIDLTAMSDDEDDDEDLPPAKRPDAAPQHDTTTAWALPPSVTNPNPNQSMPPPSHNAHMAPPLVHAADDRMRNMDVVRPIEKKNALRRSTYDVKTIARDVLLATGKHPEMRPLNGHLEILKESFRNVDNISDLSTLRWDLIDPGKPPVDAFKGDFIEIDDDDDAEDEDEPAQPKARPTAPMVPSNSTPEPRLDTQKKFHPLRPAILTLSGYSAFRQSELNPDGTPVPKKKGRPVGWRKAIHSKEAQAKLAGLSPQEYATQLKSTARATSRSSSLASHRNYNVYQCRWDGCKSELHNMDALRKHVYKFHQAKNTHNKFPCFWADCKENERSVDPRTGKPNGFSVVEDFQDHMEFAHLGPKSWEFGDGPAAGLSESQDSGSEAYLCDETGRQVTPKILPRKRSPSEGPPRNGIKRKAEDMSRGSRDTSQRPSENGYVVGFSP
ncbi:hypothetical protein HDK64DRAFT_320195, partial [Phyllosticta capitalensis]